MKVNWLKYLGFLGFAGLLSLFTDNPGYSGFFGFFAFFGFAKVRCDERFSVNINKAARNAWVISILFYVAASIFAAFTPFKAMVFAFGFGISFALQILVFTFSFQYYDNRGY